MVVIARAAGVASTIAFTTRLDPDNSIDQAGSGVRRGPGAEACVVDVAPIAPLLADVLHTGAALVDDEVGRETLLRQEGSQGIDVKLFIVAGQGRISIC